MNKVRLNKKVKFLIFSVMFIIYKMIKNLNEKEFSHAFFYSMKMRDYDHALYLLKLGATSNTSFLKRFPLQVSHSLQHLD